MRKRSGTRQVTFIKNSFFIGVVVLCATVVLVWRKEVSSGLFSIVTPVLEFRRGHTSESAALQAELVHARAAQADRDVIYAENLELKKRLNRDASVRSTLVGVLLRPPAVPYDTLVVDAGTDQGIVVGSKVAAGGTTLIGSVVEVYATTARVRLLSAPGNTYDGLLSTSAASIPVTIEGQGGGSMQTQVPAGSGVVPGNTVVLPGILGGYTGVVSYVESKSGESFETVYVRVPVNPLELRYVEIWHEASSQ